MFLDVYHLHNENFSTFCAFGNILYSFSREQFSHYRYVKEYKLIFFHHLDKMDEYITAILQKPRFCGASGKIDGRRQAAGMRSDKVFGLHRLGVDFLTTLIKDDLFEIYNWAPETYPVSADPAFFNVMLIEYTSVVHNFVLIWIFRFDKNTGVFTMDAYEDEDHYTITRILPSNFHVDFAAYSHPSRNLQYWLEPGVFEGDWILQIE